MTETNPSSSSINTELKNNSSSINIKPLISKSGFSALLQRIYELENTELSSENRLSHRLFYVKCGEIKEEYKSILNEVTDDNSEMIIEHMEWPIDDKYFSYVSEKWLMTFFETEADISEIRESILNVSKESSDSSLGDIETSSSNLWEELNIDSEEAAKYSLALNFYTGCLSENTNQSLLAEINFLLYIAN